MNQRISIILFITLCYGIVSGQLKQKQKAAINPFQIAEKIELLYYQDRMSWWDKVYPDARAFRKWEAKYSRKQDIGA